MMWKIFDFGRDVERNIKTEDEFIYCRDYVVEMLLDELKKNEDEFFGGHISINLTFPLQGKWAESMDIYLTHLFCYEKLEIEDGKLNITFFKNPMIGHLASTILRLDQKVEAIIGSEMHPYEGNYKNQAIYDIKRIIEEHNEDVYQKRELYRNLQMFLKKTLMKLIAMEVKEKYNLTTDIYEISRLLKRIVPRYNMDDIIWVDINILYSTINSILSIFRK